MYIHPTTSYPVPAQSLLRILAWQTAVVGSADEALFGIGRGDGGGGGGVAKHHEGLAALETRDHRHLLDVVGEVTVHERDRVAAQKRGEERWGGAERGGVAGRQHGAASSSSAQRRTRPPGHRCPQTPQRQ